MMKQGLKNSFEELVQTIVRDLRAKIYEADTKARNHPEVKLARKQADIADEKRSRVQKRYEKVFKTKPKLALDQFEKQVEQLRVKMRWCLTRQEMVECRKEIQKLLKKHGREVRL